MNLYFRFFYVILTALFGKPMSAMGISKIRLRCWPNDLDLNFHMNNGRYLTLMDIGRTDLMVRSGMSKFILKNKWYPVVGAQSIAFHRSIAPFAKFELQTRVTGWDDRWFFLEQEFYVKGKLCANAVVKAMFLGPEGQISPSIMAEELQIDPVSPQFSPEAKALQQQDNDERRKKLKQKIAA